ncbi:MAG: glutamine--fructose-6-phosphate transaminase (isomerizing), partial [Bacteroidota bacterium]
HTTQNGNLAMIHNGIIENYKVLKKELVARGHEFSSETDSEILIHLIEEIQLNNQCELEKAVQLALQRVEGAYAIIVMSKDDPEKLVAARKSSPLVVGIGQDEFFISSDATTMSKYVKKVVYLDDEQIAIVRSSEEIEIKTVEDIPVTPYIQKLDMNIDVLDKQGFDHYMLKEIYEQPTAIANCMRGRVFENGELHVKVILEHKERFRNASRIIIVSCGTSWHAGLVGEYMIEKYAQIPVEVEYASEFRYRDPIINSSDIVIAISQSGETADTLAALEIARSKGAFTFGICNVVGSSIARTTDAGIYTKAGSEIGVASTKAFTTQMTVMSMVALQLGQIKSSMASEKITALARELYQLPSLIGKSMSTNRMTELISEIYKDASNFIYLGRGVNFPIALEGALKLKEISYIHAEGYPAAEMKHGPIALIDESMPVVVVANSRANYEKTVSNIQEVKARHGKVIAIINDRDQEVFKIADAVVEVPETSDFLAPFLAVIPLQLLSYHVANRLGKDVDQPRNLAKSVTVE